MSLVLNGEHNQQLSQYLFQKDSKEYVFTTWDSLAQKMIQKDLLVQYKEITWGNQRDGGTLHTTS